MFLIMTLVSKPETSNDTINYMKFARAGMLLLVALLVTVIWAAILYFGSRLIGLPLEGPVLFEVLTGVFVIAMLGLGIASSSSDDADPDDAG
jgi:hypothetical protein